MTFTSKMSFILVMTKLNFSSHVHACRLHTTYTHMH